MKYKCVKSFSLEIYDVYGNSTSDYMDVNLGDIYELIQDTSYISGEAHLEKDDGLTWIEISNEILDKYFEEVKE